MKILKEHKGESFVSIYFEEDGEIFYANVNNIRGFNVCTIRKAYEKGGDYGISHLLEQYLITLDCLQEWFMV